MTMRFEVRGAVRVRREGVEAEPGAARQRLLLAVLHRAAGEHPLDEAVQARLIRALAAAGLRAAALDTWRRVRERLADELGVAPGAELRAARREVLRVVDGPVSEGRPVLVPGIPEAGIPEADAPGYPRPAQLPADLAAFTGRRAELDDLDNLCEPEGARIAVISGAGGIGKTALAVRWAHRVADRFPDGQLYADLRGSGPAGVLADPGQVLRGFLESLGVPARRIPDRAEAQAGLLRSVLARRRVLLVLDDARDAEQVRPLLPGSAGCLVVVTSRDRLAGLVTGEGMREVVAARLPDAEAREVLAGGLCAERVRAEPRAVAEIVGRCAGVPLALAVVAARAAARPHVPLGAVAAGLGTTGDVRAVLSWSYRALSPGAARLLRLLSLHPGPDVAPAAATALAGGGPGGVRRLLAELTRARLLTEHAPGRYVCHGLVTAFAAECSAREDSAEVREAAVRRLLDHCLHTARAAASVHAPSWRPGPPPSADEAGALGRCTAEASAPAAVVAGARPESFAGKAEALRWYTAEARVLAAVVERARTRGDHAHVWGLALALERLMDRRGHWHDGAALQRAGLDAAVRCGHRAAQAHLHRALACSFARLERHDDARAHLRASLALCTGLGDRLGLAHAHRVHAWLLGRLGAHDGALEAAGRALALYRELGDRAAQAGVLRALGRTHALRGDHRRAAACFEESLDAVPRSAEAGAWDSLGAARHHLGEHASAVTAYQCALRLYREAGDRCGEAGTLRRLGDTYLRTGDPGAARTVWERSAHFLVRSDPTAAAELRTRLLALGDALPPPRLALVPGV